MKTIFKIPRKYQYVIDPNTKKTIAIFNDFHSCGLDAIQDFCLRNKNFLKQYGFLASKWHDFCKKNQCLKKSLIASTICNELDEYNEETGRKIVNLKMDRRVNSLLYRFSEEIYDEYLALTNLMDISSYQAISKRAHAITKLNNLLNELVQGE